jgi:6-phosphogluconolactonase
VRRFPFFHTVRFRSIRMSLFPRLLAPLIAAVVSAGAGPSQARTVVYVASAEDGDIHAYTLTADGALAPIATTPVAKLVAPMAVSPDRRFLYAAARSKPYAVHVFAIDRATGALAPHGVAPLAESFPYISLDRTGRYLFGASYAAHLVSVNAIGPDGRVSEAPPQIVPVGRNAHAILIDRSNRYVFVPTLGSDAMFQFRFDERSGTLASNTPAVAMMAPGTGPRHLAVAPDDRHVYVLSELHATVTTFALDGATGLLTEKSSVSALPPGSRLGPGAPRLPAGAPGAPVRDTSRDIWAADLRMTPDGRFMYASERTDSTLSALAVDAATGTATFVGAVPAEPQPRGFAVDPSGRFLVCTGEKSTTVSVYAIDQGSGALSFLGRYPTGKGSSWVEIVTLD